MSTIAPPAPLSQAAPRLAAAPPAPSPRPVAPPQVERPAPPRRSRRLVLTGAVSVALVSTGSAYLAMVAFGIDVLGMLPAVAWTTAGVFELSLITVALLAREAAKENRPANTLLMLTWALSSASGAFAAWHELFIGHAPGAAAFRFLVPLLAALMWHLALIGDRHLATGTTWTAARQTARMHALFLSTEDLFRAQALLDGSRRSRRRLARAEAARRRARAVALKTVPPTEMRAQVAAWAEALRAVSDGTGEVAELHTEDRARLVAVSRPAPRPEADAVAVAVAVAPATAPQEERPAPPAPVEDERPAPRPVTEDAPVSRPAPAQPRTPRPASTEREALKAEARRLHDGGKGLSQRAIADRLKVGKSTVDRWVK